MDLYTITDASGKSLSFHDFIINECSQNTSIFSVLVYVQHNRSKNNNHMASFDVSLEITPDS